MTANACAHGYIVNATPCFPCEIAALKKQIATLQQSVEYAWKNVHAIEQHRQRHEEVAAAGIAQRDAVLETLRSRLNNPGPSVLDSLLHF